ncbi:MAG TPA: peptidylprolyl isomerase [Steroidobacteraceae bacterium]|nr:peptidylprolyl isomerase [Steroidobacteraceae bacterium]
MTGDLPTRVEVCTADFSFVIAVCTAQAPISGAYFLEDVDAGRLNGTSIFRIVNLHNQPADHPAKIEVIQMGWRETNPGIPPSLRHETTAMTGLRHRKGTVSLARFAPGAVYHSWFVCMRDEPGLDAGGLRHPDGQGFAAFGFIAEGLEHLARFFNDNAATPEYPAQPVLLSSGCGVYDAESGGAGHAQWLEQGLGRIGRRQRACGIRLLDAGRGSARR